LFSKEINKFNFTLENENHEAIVVGEISGLSQIPTLDDLKFNAVIALLNSIDQKNFSEAGQDSLFNQYINEIQGTISEMQKHSQFQGKSY
jgi:hypothetical protein